MPILADMLFYKESSQEDDEDNMDFKFNIQSIPSSLKSLTNCED